MDKTSCKLTVFFENPFWVGVLECNEDGKLTVSKLTFYKEPKDYEIRNFILKKYNQLNFSPAVENVVIEKQKIIKKDNVMLENKSNYKELEQNLNRH